MTPLQFDEQMLPFGPPLGITTTNARHDDLRATLMARPAPYTSGEILRGRAVMAVADTMGAMACLMPLCEVATGTTTIEIKTHFVRATPCAEAALAKSPAAVPQTRIESGAGTPVANVTQTQMILR